MEFKSEKLRENNQAKPKTKEEKMALNINTFSPFSMSSAFDNSFFSNRWNDDRMVPSRNLTTSSRSSGACSTRRRPRWRRTTPGWRSVHDGGADGAGDGGQSSDGR